MIKSAASAASLTFQKNWQTVCKHTRKIMFLINRHQRCGYSDSPFARRDTFLYCRAQKWVGKGGHRACTQTKSKLFLRKKTLCSYGKYVRDIKQRQKHVLDLVQSMMKPTDPAKEELPSILMIMYQFRPKKQGFGVCTLRTSGKIMDFRQRRRRSKVGHS